VSPFPVSL